MLYLIGFDVNYNINININSNKMDSYCVTCKKKTKTENANKQKTKNNRIILIGNCSLCNNKKSTFVSAKTGKGVINDILNSGYLPELHLPGHNFTGPGTKLRKRLLRQDKPVNKLDAAAKEHDMEYAIFKDTKDRHIFDKKLQDKAAEIMIDPQSSFREKAEAGLVSGIMLSKRKLGLGQKKINTRETRPKFK